MIINTRLFERKYTGSPRIVRQNGRNRKSYYVKFVLFEIEYKHVPKTVLCETILRTIRGIIVFQNRTIEKFVL